MTKDQFQKKIGANVKRIRTEKGISQSQLASACGKDRQSIHKVENGEFNATSYYLFQIAEGLEVKVSELFSFE